MLYQLSYFRIALATSFRFSFWVGRDGFEPPKVKTSRFTVCPIWPLWYLPGLIGKKRLEPSVGFEPTTLRLQITCSTSWAKKAFIYQSRCKVSEKKWNCKIFMQFFLVSQRTDVFRHLFFSLQQPRRRVNTENRCKDIIVLWKIKHSEQKICKKLIFFLILGHTYV